MENQLPQQGLFDRMMCVFEGILGREFRWPLNDKLVIAVMGQPGAGKSSFISWLAGCDIGIGRTLEPKTTRIKAVKVDCLERCDSEIVFIDTPHAGGGEDREVGEMLDKMARFVRMNPNNSADSTVFGGILYFHDITSKREGRAISASNRSSFMKLCGMDTLKNVLLTTTRWDIPDGRGWTKRGRVVELERGFWKEMMATGSTIVGHDNTPGSAWSIVQNLLRDANRKFNEALQLELTQVEKQLEKMKNSNNLSARLEGIIRHQQKILDVYRTQTGKPLTDLNWGEMRVEYEGERKKLVACIGELKAKGIVVGRCLSRRETACLRG